MTATSDRFANSITSYPTSLGFPILVRKGSAVVSPVGLRRIVAIWLQRYLANSGTWDIGEILKPASCRFRTSPKLIEFGTTNLVVEVYEFR
jgi:hypothetical protein